MTRTLVAAALSALCVSGCCLIDASETTQAAIKPRPIARLKADPIKTASIPMPAAQPVLSPAPAATSITRPASAVTPLPAPVAITVPAVLEQPAEVSPASASEAAGREWCASRYQDHREGRNPGGAVTLAEKLRGDAECAKLGVGGEGK